MAVSGISEDLPMVSGNTGPRIVFSLGNLDEFPEHVHEIVIRTA
jgi:hypothetical protein